jgi:hypothetical protein
MRDFKMFKSVFVPRPATGLIPAPQTQPQGIIELEFGIHVGLHFGHFLALFAIGHETTLDERLLDFLQVDGLTDVRTFALVVVFIARFRRFVPGGVSLMLLFTHCHKNPSIILITLTRFNLHAIRRQKSQFCVQNCRSPPIFTVNCLY